MRISALFTALALGTTVSAQRPAFQYNAPGGKPVGQPSGSSDRGPPGQGQPNGLANPFIPVGQTKTETATALGGLKSIIPTVPTASPSAQAPATGSNSTSNASNSTTVLVSTSDDAKKNPNLPNSPSHRGNWAPGFDINTDVETTWPNTGNVVKYTLEITNGTVAPQGDKKIGFLINGQFPGPKLEANWGDMFEITVINKLTNNGTVIHWHGFTQKNSNLQDGVGGITECPIAPGTSRVYRFQATSYGTSWYHSHFSGQYGDGVLGPIVVNGPTSYNYDIDLGTVMVSDYYTLTAFQEQWFAARFGPPTAANYLLNGKNVKVDGSGGERSKWTFTPGKKHKIRLINSSTENQFKIQIDGHSLIVVAIDLVPINPYRTSELSLIAGQRYDVIVEANQPTGNYWFRALAAKDCSFNANDGTGIANGIISYTGASDALPTSKLSASHSDACVDEPLSVLKPIVKIPVDSAAFSANSNQLPVGAGVVRTSNDTVFQWTIGGISQLIDWSNPTMSNAVDSKNTYDAAKHVVSLPNANVWTYWVLQNQFFAPHPMHVHGHDFAILGQGNGVFNSASASSTLNFADPPRRDVVQLVPNGWTVIAFKTDNPGAWLMHCHIAWHVSGGLSLQYLERPSEIPAMYKSQVQSSDFQNQCTNWKKYAASMVYKQSDSGLKRREVVGDVEMDMFQLEEFPERRSIETTENVVKRQVSHWV